MTKEQKNTLWRKATGTTLKRTVIVLFIVVGIPLLAYSAAEFLYQNRVQKLTGALSEIGKNEVESRGGRGQGVGVDSSCTYAWDAFWAIDNGPCPRAGSSYWVPIKAGEEVNLIADILAKEGYDMRRKPEPNSQLITAGGIKNGVGLSVEMIITDSNAPKQSLPEGERWARLNISAQEAN